MASGYAGAGGLYGNAGRTWGDINQNRVDYLQNQDKLNAQGWGSLAGGAGSLLGLMLSDENIKEDKREVRGVLDALKKMPVEAWKYKDGEGDGGEHVGTYAQDFKKATGLGDGKTISVIDALGVTMGAVKELAEKVEKAQGKSEKPTPKGKSILRRVA